MDIITYSLCNKKAKSYTDTVINNLPKGVVYRGSVNYYADLPNTAELGDCYTVVYKGATGTESSGAEYVWGLNTATNIREWIKIGEEIDLSKYATQDWVNTQISDFLPDVETYKTAELTEGQITDVIGVNDIKIKGQTSQAGEPTPDSPVDVNVVSGSNVINIYNGQTLSKELPLDLGSVELCKIGNHQDYFYKSGGKWYLHKRIQKRILNGSEPWGLGRNSSPYVFTFNITDYLRVEENIIVNTHFQSAVNGIYGPMTDGQIKFRYHSDVTNLLYICTTIGATVSEFKTWLSNNNVTIYYVLREPIITEITDTTLINQLEAIYNAPLYKQTNITQTNNDLPMVLDITAYKDNINGIKAYDITESNNLLNQKKVDKTSFVYNNTTQTLSITMV